MPEKPTILFIALIPKEFSPYLATSYGMDCKFDLLPHKHAILSLVAWLRENGCDGHYVWIESPDEDGMAVIDEAISLAKPDAIGFSLVTEEMMSHYRVIELLKESHPILPVIVGGPHVSAQPEHTLVHFPLIDFVVIGEGEVTLTQWLQRIAAGQDLIEFSEVDGLAYRDESGGINLTSPREKITDINFLPDPAYDLIFDPDIPPDEYSAYPLICSYGCYFFCTFCSVEHGNYRCIKPERVVDRIERARKKFGVEYFAIRDSFWPPTREWLSKFCDEIEKRGLKIRFHFQTRAGTLEIEHLERLRRIGAQVIAIGVEAGDPVILKSIKKSITINMARKSVAAINKAGIFSIAFFIFGNKGENRETIQASIDLANELNASMTFFHVLYPLPGAEAFDSVPDNEKDWWMGVTGLPSICDLPVREMVQLSSETFLRYPLRWAYFRQHVLGGRLPGEFRRIARRIFFLHLRKYILGTSERFGPFRSIIRCIKSILRR